MPTTLDKQLGWIKEIMKKHDLSASALANQAGINRPDLTQRLNGKLDYAMKYETLKSVADRFNEYLPSYLSGMAETDAVEWDHQENLTPKPDNTTNYYKVTTTELIDAGIDPGDILEISPNLTPRDGGLVLLRIINLATQSKDTVLRWCRSPYYLSLIHI